jgi:hypothetical protein
MLQSKHFKNPQISKFQILLIHHSIIIFPLRWEIGFSDGLKVSHLLMPFSAPVAVAAAAAVLKNLMQLIVIALQDKS